MMNALLRKDEEPVPYKAVTLISPLIEMYNRRQAKAASKVIRGMYLINSQANTPEMKINSENVPDHSKPWVFDFENRFQRKIVPARTVLSLQDEIARHAGLIGQASSGTSALSKAMCCGHGRSVNAYHDIDIPVQIIVGPNDKVVCNEAAREVFALLPTERGS